MDSEGNSAVDRTSSYDAQLFTLLVLISSIIVYNSLGVIDESTINNLSVVSQFAKNLALKVSGNDPKILTSITPKFFWLIKDFSLDLKDEKNEIISANEYLESCLHDKAENGKYAESNAQVRKAILSIFKERECITLIRPVNEEKDIQNLSNIPFEQLKPTFQTQFLDFKKKLFEGCKEKLFNGIPIDGSTIKGLLIKYVDEINKGSIPNISNAFDSFSENQIILFFERSSDYFLKQIKLFNTKNDLPLEEIDLYKEIEKLKRESLTMFQECKKYIRFDSQFNLSIYNNHLSKFENIVAEAEINSIKKNKNNSERLCLNIFRELELKLEKKIVDNFYSIDKTDLINEDLKVLSNQYNDQAKGPSKLLIFSNELIKLQIKLMKNLQYSHNHFVDEISQAFQAKVYAFESHSTDLEIKINNLENENKSLKTELKLSNEQNQKLQLQIPPPLNSTNRNLISSNDNICNPNDIKIERTKKRLKSKAKVSKIAVVLIVL